MTLYVSEMEKLWFPYRNERPNDNSKHIVVCFKDHLSTFLAARSANIATLLFPSCSLAFTPPSRRQLLFQIWSPAHGESDHPWLGHVQTPLTTHPIGPPPSLSWNKLAPSCSLCSLCCFSKVRAIRGGKSESWVRAGKTERARFDHCRAGQNHKCITARIVVNYGSDDL